MTCMPVLSAHVGSNRSRSMYYHGRLVKPLAPKNVVMSEVNAGALGWTLGEDDT
jgi:hypothetical protein